MVDSKPDLSVLIKCSTFMWDALVGSFRYYKTTTNICIFTSCHQMFNICVGGTRREVPLL